MGNAFLRILAVVHKDRVPYEIWNKLIGEEKP